MSRRIWFFLPLMFFAAIVLHAQTSEVRGKLVDAKTNQSLVGAHVRLAEQRDTSKSVVVTTGARGEFVFSNVRWSTYVLTATSIGHETLRKVVLVEQRMHDLGSLIVQEDVIVLDEILIRGKVPPAVQKGDTTEFNAEAFKINRDATAEELVAKMPGVTVEGGTVKSQGEDVQRVLVDGRLFFGNDPTAALRNLPAETIEKIQIFDKLSEQAEFTGFDDGQSQRTMNIVTRPERRIGEFGKTYAGYGDEGRYAAGGNLNVFRSEMRLSIIGMSNNVNQQNFSMQDLLGVAGGGGGRGGFGGGGRRGSRALGPGAGGSFTPGAPGRTVENFLVGQQNGVTQTHSIGANYSDTWGKDLSVTQSYFFNDAQNDNRQSLRREYPSSRDSSTLYDEKTLSDSKNYNHRVDGRWMWSVDSSNSLIIQPQLYFQRNRAASSQAGINSFASGMPINSAISMNDSRTNGNSLSGQITWRHRFERLRRTLSLDARVGHNDKNGSGRLHSHAIYEGVGGVNDTTDQQSVLESAVLSLSARLAYTEPLAERGMLQISYSPSYSKSNSDSRRTGFDPITRTYSILLPQLSNVYENAYTTHHASIGYRMRDSSYGFTGEIGYQTAQLRGEQQLPQGTTVSKMFRNILPSANINFSFCNRTNLRVFYRTATRAPSITQLQNVLDNTNPLLLFTGNLTWIIRTHTPLCLGSPWQTRRRGKVSSRSFHSLSLMTTSGMPPSLRRETQPSTGFSSTAEHN